jgi:lipopolysaccharide transport protein LptA
MIAPPDKEGGQLLLTGQDLQADLSTNEIKIDRDVKGSKRVKDNKDLNIESERAVFSGSTKMAHFLGNVVLSYDKMTAKGPEARFSYDSAGDKLQSVIVDGGVKVTDVDKYAVGHNMNIDFERDEVVFRGSPRVTQNGDELTGDEIVFLNGGHKVKVRNARAEFQPENDVDESEREKKNK